MSSNATLQEKENRQARFDRLAAEWKSETLFLSKISAKVLHPAYQKIIGMGADAIPFILRDLKDNGPNHWGWALNAITDDNPVSKDAVGNISAMSEAWLQWGVKKGYLENCRGDTAPHSQT
jgi:hypothetical protein